MLTAETFWAEVRALRAPARGASTPSSADAVASYDLFRAGVRHSCLNRLQLRNTLQMVDLTDQAESLIYAGTLRNPIAVPERVEAAS